MARADFRLDPTFEGELFRSNPIRELLEPQVEAVAARARELAPDDPRTPGSSIAKGIEGQVGMRPAGWVGRVNGFDFKTGWFEFGTSRTPARRMLGQALEELVGPVESGGDDG